MSRKANPLQVPQRGPYGERYLLTGHFYNGDDDARDIYMILRKLKASQFKPLVTGRQVTNTHYLHCGITVNYILPSCLVLNCTLQV